VGFFDIFRRKPPLSHCGTIDWVIFGIGNYPRRYRYTRHNIGFRVIDAIHAAMVTATDIRPSSFNHVVHGTLVSGCSVLCAKPRTYVNRCGMALQEIIEETGVPPEKCIVVVDDCSLPCATLRLRKKGSAGGHNGLKSILSYIGTGFPRMRIGIGKPPAGEDLVTYVLGVPSPEEQKKLNRAVTEACSGIEMVCTEGIDMAIHRVNTAAKDTSHASHTK
jgi:PTH1 family peptidyl-tRNA hydrolase